MIIVFLKNLVVLGDVLFSMQVIVSDKMLLFLCSSAATHMTPVEY